MTSDLEPLSTFECFYYDDDYDYSTSHMSVVNYTMKGKHKKVQLHHVQ